MFIGHMFSPHARTSTFNPDMPKTAGAKAESLSGERKRLAALMLNTLLSGSVSEGWQPPGQKVQSAPAASSAQPACTHPLQTDAVRNLGQSYA